MKELKKLMTIDVYEDYVGYLLKNNPDLIIVPKTIGFKKNTYQVNVGVRDDVDFECNPKATKDNLETRRINNYICFYDPLNEDSKLQAKEELIDLLYDELKLMVLGLGKLKA